MKDNAYCALRIASAGAIAGTSPQIIAARIKVAAISAVRGADKDADKDNGGNGPRFDILAL
jgi:hypothetical protein